MARLHFYRPVEENQTIWRYMDFPRFVSLFLTRSLYFNPAYFLREQEPFEFRIPKQLLVDSRRRLRESLLAHGEPNERTDRIVEQMTSPSCTLHHWAVNCWTAGAHESYALWKTFVPGSDGVAVKSTVMRLKNSIADPNRLLVAGRVDYIDYRSEVFEANDHSQGFEQMFHKARFYEHESEFRIIAWPEFESGVPLEFPEAYLSPITSASLRVPVILETLIEEVRVSPYAKPWFHALVRDFVQSHFGDRLQVVESAMASAAQLD